MTRKRIILPGDDTQTALDISPKRAYRRRFGFRQKESQAMGRGRPPNLPRQQARERGDKTYASPDNPCDFCGGEERYVANAQCVGCLIAKGKARYATMTEAQLAELKERDRRRYAVKMGRDPDLE